MPHHHIPLFHCIHWFDHFAPKTLFPSSYTTIPLHPLEPLVWSFYTKDIVPTTMYHYSTMSTTSTGLIFLHQRQCPHHHIPLFHCIHCVHWFDLFEPKTMSPSQYTTIPLHPLVWPFCTIDNVLTTIYCYSTASTTSTGLTFLYQRQCSDHHIPLFHSIHWIHWFDLFAPKTMSPLPYTTISLCLLHPLHPLCTVSTASTAYCIHCVLHPLHTASTDLTFLDQRQCPTTMYHYSTASTGLTFMHQRQCPHHHILLFHCVHCIYCVHLFDLFAPKTIFPSSYTTIPLHPLDPLVWPFYTKDIVPIMIYHYSTISTASTGLTFLYQRQCPTIIYHYSTASTVSIGLTFLHQRQCPHHHIPLFHCIHCVLHPLHTVSTPWVWPFWTKVYCIHYMGLTFLNQTPLDPLHPLPVRHTLCR